MYLESCPGNLIPEISGSFSSVITKKSSGYIYFIPADALAHGTRLYRTPPRFPTGGSGYKYESIDTGSEIPEWLVLENGDIVTRNILNNNEEKLILISGETLKTKAEFTFPKDSNTAKTISSLSANNNGVFFTAGRTLYKLSSANLSIDATYNTRDDITHATLDGDKIFITTHRFNADVIGAFESSRLISVSAKDMRETFHFYTTMKILNIFPAGGNIIVEAFRYDTNKKHIVTLNRNDLSIKSEITPDAINFTTAFPAANSFLLYNENTLESLSPDSLSIRSRINIQDQTFYSNGCSLYALSSDKKTITIYDTTMLVQSGAYNFPLPVESIFDASRIDKQPADDSTASTSPCASEAPVYVVIGSIPYTLK